MTYVLLQRELQGFTVRRGIRYQRWQIRYRRWTKGASRFGTRRNALPCPETLWKLISFANTRWSLPVAMKRSMRAIARSNTSFRTKDPKLNQALKLMELEWLTPSQISRVRECPAPQRKSPRKRLDRWFGYAGIRGVDPQFPKRSIKCNRLFWAWRHDQKTCDQHWWASSMLRVEKHRKGKSKQLRKARQLKDARLQSKRVRRANKREQKLAEKRQRPPLTPSQLQKRSDMADFRLLQAIRYDLDYTDPERLEIMVEEGYVSEKSGVRQLSGKGLRLMGELKKKLATN